MDKLHELLISLINSIGVFGPVLVCFIIFFESILPFIPLSVFITINFLAFGNVVGFILSWIFTIMGCIMSFYIFRKGVQVKFNKIIKNKKTLENFMLKFKDISLGSLVVLIAIPFTPAFLVNIAAGLSKMKFKKFLVALIIGKVSIVYFWGYIGKSLVESFQEPMLLLKIGVIVVATYLISKLVNKKLSL